MDHHHQIITCDDLLFEKASTIDTMVTLFLLDILQVHYLLQNGDRNRFMGGSRFLSDKFLPDGNLDWIRNFGSTIRILHMVE